MAEVMANEPASIYVNIQGDEPMITPGHLERLLRPFDEAPATQVSTLKVAIDAETALDPKCGEGGDRPRRAGALFLPRAHPLRSRRQRTSAIFQAPGVLCI